MRETETHIYFWGTYLSNFARAPFKMTLPTGVEMTFLTSEHAFMALKALEFNDIYALTCIYKAIKPQDAKAFGRQIRNFDPEVWDKVSYSCMYNACIDKFTQNLDMKWALIETFPKILVEASPMDKIWGVGLHFEDDRILDEANWQGENRLGKVLMHVRQDLRHDEGMEF